MLYFIVTLYFFYIAFVGRNADNLENIDDKGNKPLWAYRDFIASGLDYIKTKDCERVYTKSFDGLNLSARYFDNGFKKVIILVHGYRSAAARDFSCAVEMYTRLGFNILLVDQRCLGKSEGRLITFGVKESRDLLSWINLVNEKYSPEKIVLGGMSMGASTVLFANKYDLPDNVVGIIADSGFTSPIEIINKVARQYFKINASVFLPFLNVYCKIFGRFSLYDISTVDAVKNSNLPILFIHGKDDSFVPCEMSISGYEAAKERSEILIIDNADHGMGFLVEPENVFEKLKAFLAKV